MSRTFKKHVSAMKCVMKTHVTFKPGRMKILTFLHAGEVLVTNCLHCVIKTIL